ncbi:Collagen alpha-1(XII) chain [Liparis tanakae]|uniref:Collagen alpha-1(XII) chain n=1 Tax=Liparis tanakae TaxID=230148 RepID=A0A4Z2EXI9_9TELE|nr:Collagen alpha-1(XII) chain [Liparis tanakae]
MRVFGATTSSLTIGWDHAEGPVRQYRVSYAPLGGDATQFVSNLGSSTRHRVLHPPASSTRPLQTGSENSSEAASLKMWSCAVAGDESAAHPFSEGEPLVPLA